MRHFLPSGCAFCLSVVLPWLAAGTMSPAAHAVAHSDLATYRGGIECEVPKLSALQSGCHDCQNDTVNFQSWQGCDHQSLFFCGTEDEQLGFRPDCYEVLQNCGGFQYEYNSVDCTGGQVVPFSTRPCAKTFTSAIMEPIGGPPCP